MKNLFQMKNKITFFTLLTVCIFVVGGYFIYEKMIKEKIANITPQTLKINNLKDPKIYALSKHKDQTGIFQLDMHFDGKAEDYITIYLGPERTVFTTQIRLKKGEIATSHINEWHSDSAFLRIESAKGGELEVGYQFIGM